jgi:hypothetical protein
MASNINPTNINGAYPIAGQDNDSQGFRDNFTNIRTNLVHAKTELEDLQRSVILKNPLTVGGSVTNSFNGVLMTGAQTQGFTETIIFNFAQGDYQKVTVNTGVAGFTFDFEDWPASGVYATMRVLFVTPVIDTGPLSPIIFPPSVTAGTNALLNYDTGTLTAKQPGSYFLEFSTIDGGTNVSVVVLSTPDQASDLMVTTTNNNLKGHVLSNFAQQTVTKTLTAPSAVVDLSVADFHRITSTQTMVLSFTNWPSSGYATTRVWATVDDPTNPITLPPEVTIGRNKLPSLSVVGDYLFEFSSMDAGATVLVVPLITPL